MLALPRLAWRVSAGQLLARLMRLLVRPLEVLVRSLEVLAGLLEVLVRLLGLLAGLLGLLAGLLEMLAALLEMLTWLVLAGVKPWALERGWRACSCSGWSLACALIGGSRRVTGRRRRCST